MKKTTQFPEKRGRRQNLKPGAVAPEIRDKAKQRRAFAVTCFREGDPVRSIVASLKEHFGVPESTARADVAKAQAELLGADAIPTIDVLRAKAMARAERLYADSLEKGDMASALRAVQWQCAIYGVSEARDLADRRREHEKELLRLRAELIQTQDVSGKSEDDLIDLVAANPMLVAAITERARRIRNGDQADQPPTQ